MGSSPGSDDTPPPSPKGPPIDQLMPASPPPRPMSALPENGGVATGLTPQILNSWAQEQARRDAAVQAMFGGGDSGAAAGGAPGAAGGASPLDGTTGATNGTGVTRQELARMLFDQMFQERHPGQAFGNGPGRMSGTGGSVGRLAGPY